MPPIITLYLRPVITKSCFGVGLMAKRLEISKKVLPLFYKQNGAAVKYKPLGFRMTSAFVLNSSIVQSSICGLTVVLNRAL